MLVFSRKSFGLCQSSSCVKRNCISWAEVFYVFFFPYFRLRTAHKCNRNEINRTHVNCTEFASFVSLLDTKWSHANFNTHLMVASCIKKIKEFYHNRSITSMWRQVTICDARKMRVIQTVYILQYYIVEVNS